MVKIQLKYIASIAYVVILNVTIQTVAMGATALRCLSPGYDDEDDMIDDPVGPTAI